MKILMFAVLAACTASVAQTAECDMSLAFQQSSIAAPTRRTPVFATNSPGVPALLFARPLNVNTDGTRKSYSIDDFWGKTVALNNLCNAMSDNCAAKDDKESAAQKEARLRARRVATQAAYRAGWPAEALKQTRLDPAILPMVGGKPCPAVDGFLVSATALHVRGMNDACNITNYLDALSVAALVIPRGPVDPADSSKRLESDFAKHRARIGDLAVVLRRGASTPVFAVVGDTGPANKLGEGSIALNAALLGQHQPPKNYEDAKKLVVDMATVLIFPGTRDEENPYLSQARIDTAAETLFGRWGGLERLQACVRSQRPSAHR